MRTRSCFERFRSNTRPNGSATLIVAVCVIALAVRPAAAGGTPFTPTAPVEHYEWHVSYRKAAPDCFAKNIIVINGNDFEPEIRVRRGHILEVNVFNDLPPNYPSLTNGGISIHWHGLSMHDQPWYDGVAYVHQCPIKPAQNFTYRFPITDAPGTYFWHDHASGNHADGLAGPLIIEPEEGTPPADEYDEEANIFLHDWFHTQGDVLAIGLNRPFDPSKATIGRGAWNWVQVPQAILINGKGSQYDCPLGPPPSPANLSCAVDRYTVAPGLAGQPMASAANPGCTHFSLDVKAGKTYLLRVTNAGTLAMQNLCFEGHNVTIVAADATPTEPLEVPCVNVNLGQRYDLLLTASQAPDNYWITSAPLYRSGSPNGYGVLHYEGAPNKTLPSTVPPQPGTIAPWTLNTINSIHTRKTLLDPATAAGKKFPWPGNQTTLAVPKPTKRFRIEITQPVLMQTGQLRWGLNNIAHADVPTCAALLDEIYNDPSYIERNEVRPGQNDSMSGTLGDQNSGDTALGPNIYTDVFPSAPMAGRHILSIQIGDVVEMLIQNNEADDFMGNYGNLMARNASEQHPFHLHGHHFWLVGSGSGRFDPSNATLNTDNPVWRDTATVPPYGWVLFRFIADNRGTWLLHCHILWHQIMGQTLIFSSEAAEVAPPPELPKCPKHCPAQFAPWRPEYVVNAFGATPFEIPLNAADKGQAGK